MSASVSLTMIVRDEEANLPRCLASVRGLFDEVVVVDTGSTDRTKEIAASFGAVVHDFAWCDDFAAARNAAHDRAGGDYCARLDGDEWLEPGDRERLAAFLAGLRGDGAAYDLACDSDPMPGRDRTADGQVRLFPRRGWRWRYRVHELPGPIDPGHTPVVRETGIVVRHSGYADPATVARKMVRNYRLLRLDLLDRPGDVWLLLQLADHAEAFGDIPAAREYVRRLLAAPDCHPDSPLALGMRWTLGQFDRRLEPRGDGDGARPAGQDQGMDATKAVLVGTSA